MNRLQPPALACVLAACAALCMPVQGQPAGAAPAPQPASAPSSTAWPPATASVPASAPPVLVPLPAASAPAAASAPLVVVAPPAASAPADCCTELAGARPVLLAKGAPLALELSAALPRVVVDGQPLPALFVALPQRSAAAAIGFRAQRLSAGLFSQPLGAVMPMFLFLDAERRPMDKPAEPKELRFAPGSGGGRLEGWMPVPADARFVAVVPARRYASGRSIPGMAGSWTFEGEMAGPLSLRLFGG